MKLTRLWIGLAATSLVGCGLIQVNGKPLDLSSSSSSSESSETAEGASAPKGGEKRDFVPSAEAKQYLAECGAKIEASQKLWSEQEKKTRAAIAASEQAGLYEGWLGLMNQYRDNCKAREKLGQELSQKVFRSTAVELSLAVARFQVRHGLSMRSPLEKGDQASDAKTWVPLGEDATFNRAETCRTGVNVDYLSTAEFNAWKAKHDPIITEQQRAIDALYDALNAVRSKVGGDYGKIKKAQKLPDGGVKLSMMRLYGGAECVHSGQWRFNGTFWTDCDYVPAAEKEIYPFTITFPAQRIPKQGLQVGDVIHFWGLTTKPGPDEKHPDEGAEYDGLMVTNQVRGTKGLLEVPTFERPLDCVRVD